jgi:hypothetical protein
MYSFAGVRTTPRPLTALFGTFWMDQGVSLFDVVVVCDNASIHAGVKEVVALSDYVGVELIKLSPYSPMLNPI